MIASLEPDPRSEEIGKAVGLDKTSSVSIGLFTDQGASGERERTSPHSRKNWRGCRRKQKADLNIPRHHAWPHTNAHLISRSGENLL